MSARNFERKLTDHILGEGVEDSEDDEAEDDDDIGIYVSIQVVLLFFVVVADDNTRLNGIQVHPQAHGIQFS